VDGEEDTSPMQTAGGWGEPGQAHAGTPEFDMPFSNDEKSPPHGAPDQDDAQQPSAWAGLERTPTPGDAQEESRAHLLHLLAPAVAACAIRMRYS
jgi:hypothetical protein